MRTCRQTKPIWLGRTFPTVARWFALLLCAASAGSARAAEPDANVSLRLAFSSAMFTQVNENDARASVKAWGQTVAKTHGVAGDLEALIANGAGAMIKMLQSGQADGAVLPITEYAEVCREVRFSHVFVATHGGDLTEAYVVLVPRDSAVKQLADLHGRQLFLFSSPRTCLAEPWLDSQLRQGGQLTFATFFGRIQRVAKLSKAVLPVFFRQTDACLVTRRGFDTMGELNPQLRQQLRVIAASPALVPVVFCIRAEFRSAVLEEILNSLRELHTTPAGLQVLTVFQSERLTEQPPEYLAASLALLAEQDRAAAEVVVAQAAAGDAHPKGGPN